MEPVPSNDRALRIHTVPVSGALQPYVRVLMATELGETGPLPLAIAPHDAMMLTVQLGRTGDCIEAKGAHGENTHLTGIRNWTGTFTGAGDCVSLFALLTPLGAVGLLDSQPLDGVPRIRARVAELLDTSLTKQLESDIARADTLAAKLHALAAWLEARATMDRRLSRAALRAGRAAMEICAQPALAVETAADRQHVSRRQLERDFQHWLGTSPRHLAQVARLQAVSRKARAGASLADVAADTGFADQPHLSRVVRQLTGMTPRRFTSAPQSPMAVAFQHATAGGTVYL